MSIPTACPTEIHRLTYRRANRNLHVRGDNEKGTITTQFDMRVQNKLDLERNAVTIFSAWALVTSVAGLAHPTCCL